MTTKNIDNDMPEDDAEELARIRQAQLAHMQDFLLKGFAHTVAGMFVNDDLERMIFIADLLKYINMGFIYEGENDLKDPPIDPIQFYKGF